MLYNPKPLIYAVLTGSAIGLLLDWLPDQQVFQHPWSYVFAICISVTTLLVSEQLYIRLLIRKHVPIVLKYLAVYGLALFIYATGNMLFLGLDIFRLQRFYLFGGVIVLAITPVVYSLHRRMAAYGRYLERKQDIRE